MEIPPSPPQSLRYWGRQVPCPFLLNRAFHSTEIRANIVLGEEMK